MSKKIVWSPLSESDLENTLSYLQIHWNNQVVTRFLDLIDTIVAQIAINPKQFPFANKKRNVRKCVATKSCTIFYRENKGHIDILRIFDNRQDPKKKQFE